MIRVERFKKAWPSGAGFEFGAGSKEWQTAQAAAVNAVHFVVEKTAAKGRLSPMVEQDPAFLGSELLGENVDLGWAEWIQLIA